MRIALISEHQPSRQDGLGGLLFHLLEQIESNGHSGLLVTPQSIPLTVGRTQIVGLGENWQGGDSSNDLGDVLASFQPDLLHVVQPIALGMDGMRAARQLGVRVIASYHSELLQLARLWGFSLPGELMTSYFRMIQDLADLNLVPTYFHEMQLKERGFENIGVWSRGVDCDLFSPKRRSAAWRRHLTNGDVTKTLLLYVGRLSSEKHVELLRPIIAQNPNCALAIVGAGSEATWLRDHFENTPTVFTGYLDQGDLAEVYASADIFIQPTSTDISSVTTLEAMASGLPVVAPHSPAILDFAVHGENALLVVPGDTDQMASYVNDLSSKPTLRSDLSRIARQTATARTWPIAANKLFAIYRRLLDTQPSRLTLPAMSFESVAFPQ